MARHNMKQWLGWLMGGAGLAVAMLWVGAPATAARAAQQGPCNTQSLRGDFGLIASGVRRIPAGPFAGQNELVVGTAMRTYDGAGGFVEEGSGLHGQLTGVTGGAGGARGTYEVDANCTGRSILHVPVPGVPPILSTFVVVDGGREIREAVMEPTPNVVTVSLRRR